jgi:hypothetical protein
VARSADNVIDITTAPRSEAYERLSEEARPADVRRLAEAMDEAMLECRRFRQHRWTPSSATKVRGGFNETLICDRCGAEKDRFYNSRGRLTEYSAVRYPEGYLFTGLGRMGQDGRDAINLVSLRRTVARFEATGGRRVSRR